MKLLETWTMLEVIGIIISGLIAVIGIIVLIIYSILEKKKLHKK